MNLWVCRDKQGFFLTNIKPVSYFEGPEVSFFCKPSADGCLVPLQGLRLKKTVFKNITVGEVLTVGEWRKITGPVEFIVKK